MELRLGIERRGEGVLAGREVAKVWLSSLPIFPQGRRHKLLILLLYLSCLSCLS